MIQRASRQAEPGRSFTTLLAMGTLVAMTGCGDMDAATGGKKPVTGPDGVRDEQRTGPFTADSEATAGAYREVLSRHGLDLAAHRFGAPVPRLFAARMPEDMDSLKETELRRSVFVGTLLPIVLDVNARIRLERARILAVAERVQAGEPVHDFDRSWIDRLALRYGAENLRELLRRVDEIPPSLAIAQAAVDSGWGGSRFAQDGNALFGQRLVNGEDGLRPAGYEDDPGFRVAAFPDLTASVESYALNLNTHPTYRTFRLRRERQRETADGGPLDGHALAATMHVYSAGGWGYVVMVRSIIRDSRLQPLDNARLRPLATGKGPVVAASHAAR
jgi:Bax protein